MAFSKLPGRSADDNATSSRKAVPHDFSNIDLMTGQIKEGLRVFDNREKNFQNKRQQISNRLFSVFVNGSKQQDK